MRFGKIARRGKKRTQALELFQESLVMGLGYWW